MRLCRYKFRNQTSVGFFEDDRIIPLSSVAKALTIATKSTTVLPISNSLLPFLPPDGEALAATRKLAEFMQGDECELSDDATLQHDQVELLIPIPRPNKLFLLAGNYAKHIEEGGGIAAERAETFPYVFMKPPTTTLTDPGKPIRIPSVSPDHIDWELELAVIIGREAKGVSEADALNYVAGYTVINDISNRKFKPNPNRKEREKDGFFDWLHGKWHDSFCPCGPCVVTPDEIPDPQKLDMTLSVNGKVHQDASTAQQIFPVAAVIEFISSFVTLEPGDIISTGTAAGVGSSTGTFLKAGDQIEASITGIGTLKSPVIAE
ncbi:MAG: fumarylacetoacetate hydrolase family protein [Planctomycetaceae bacterium]|nr:fumarylacetoacetate hydrolase family protein [Planctomycetales bacterium]MCB9925130.1 fumarylacetoacetate hydrolase family protein [Planctomycetaceae bacterium]